MPADIVERLQSLGGLCDIIGFRVTKVTYEETVAMLTIGDQHKQPHGIVHGGVYAAMVESACSIGAAMQVFYEERNIVGLDNHTTFLRAVKEGTLTVTATPIKCGRRTHLWQASVADDQGRIAAHGQVNLMVLASDGPSLAMTNLNGSGPAA
ncbi:MAG: PaaI family thioesterase [Myxococcota bacterium]